MRFDQRKRKIALTGDERAQVRGSSAVLVPTPRRHIKVISPPRRVGIKSTVYDADGNVHLKFAPKPRKARKARNVHEHKAVVPKRAKLAAGATYGDSWNSKPPTADRQFTGYHFRGQTFATFAEYQAHLENL
jgi:hypothetical protein